MLRSLITIASFLTISGSKAQSGTVKPDPYPMKGAYIGVGLGQDMGGLGVRLSYLPTKYASCFIGGGWALAGAAWNAGAELRGPITERATVFLVGMYGYNGVVVIQNDPDLNRIFYGLTLGTGVILREHFTRNHWRFSVNLPYRDEFYDHIDSLRLRGMYVSLLPVSVGVAYHICLTAPPKAKPAY